MSSVSRSLQIHQRQIYLDFHTSPHIPGVAADFDVCRHVAIPQPELTPAVQKTIATEVRRLHTQAEAVWQAAKSWFEEQL